MLRRHVEHVAGHFGVWAWESQHLDRQPERKYQEHDAEDPPDHLGRYLPGNPHTRLLLQPSPCDGAGRGWRGRPPSNQNSITESVAGRARSLPSEVDRPPARLARGVERGSDLVAPYAVAHRVEYLRFLPQRVGCRPRQ